MMERAQGRKGDCIFSVASLLFGGMHVCGLV